MTNIEILKNSYTHNLNSGYINNLNTEYMNNLNYEYMNNLTNIEIIHPYFNKILNIPNTNLNYFKNILKTQKSNNLKKKKLQDFFLV